MIPFRSEAIAKVFDGFEPEVGAALLGLRALVFAVAAEIDQVTGVEESLKWGQPSYSPKPKTGTPIRLGVTKSGAACLFVHCQTSLVADLEADNAHGLHTIDNRAVVLPKIGAEDHPGLPGFVRAALTYHI